MWFLYDNIVAIQVAVVACAFAWIFGGTVAWAILPAMPWLLVLLLEVMVCYPQRHMGESTYMARDRVWRAMRKDPLVWVALAFILLLAVPFCNKGLCPVCDYPALNFDGAKDAIRYLPFCVDRMDHLEVFMWFASALVAMVAVKHSLLKRGKRILLELVVWNGFALSIVGFIESAVGAPGPLWADFDGTNTYFFSTFGYPNMAGDYFTTLFALAVALWRRRVDDARMEESSQAAGDGDASAKADHRMFWTKHLYAIPTVFFFFSTMITLSRASILLVVSLALLFYMHALTCHLKRLSRVKRVRTTVLNIFALLAIATIFFLFMSDNVRQLIARAKSSEVTSAESQSAQPAEGPDFAKRLEKELDSIDAFSVLDRMSGHAQYHVRVATGIWKKYPLFGCGGWGYRHLCIPEMTDAEYAKLQKVGGANVHNDLIQFLCEHGAVGVALLVAMVVMLVWPLGRVWRALLNSVRFQKPKDQPPRPLSLFVLPAPVFCILLAAFATLIHSMADCPLRSPAVLTLFFISLAAMDGFTPRVRER